MATTPAAPSNLRTMALRPATPSSSSSSSFGTAAFFSGRSSLLSLRRSLVPGDPLQSRSLPFPLRPLRGVVLATATPNVVDKDKEGGVQFVDEMRAVAMRLHTKEQAPREGKKEVDGKTPPMAKWEPTVEGYLRFLVDSKLVYDTLDSILLDPLPESSPSWYADFRSTGLERSEPLAKDLEWFKGEGHKIPEPSSPGISYARYLRELSEKDPPAFICHFYNIYFAHTAGGRMIGKKVAEKILNGKELEFYKWDGNLSQLLQNVRSKINHVAANWSREEKNHCLDETEMSFVYSGEILRLILS